MTELPQSSDFPSNTNKEKRVEKVIKNKPVQRRYSFLRTVLRSFIAEDVEDIRSYILLDVVIPAIKDTILDAATGGLDRLFYGESRTRRRRSSLVNNRPSNYTVYSTKNRDVEKRNVSPRARATHDFREIVLEERSEAETVIDRLSDLIEDYEIATVADLYALVDISASYTDDKWGWSSPEGFRIRHVRGGYLLDLPRPMPVE